MKSASKCVWVGAPIAVLAVAQTGIASAATVSGQTVAAGTQAQARPTYETRIQAWSQLDAYVQQPLTAILDTVSTGQRGFRHSDQMMMPIDQALSSTQDQHAERRP